MSNWLNRILVALCLLPIVLGAAYLGHWWLFALAAIPLWRRVGAHAKATTDQPFLNRRADAFVGQIFTLEKPIVDGAGTVRIDDTVWRVAGPDAPAGSRVRIVQADGANLTVAGE